MTNEIKYFEGDWIWDIETFPNIVTFAFLKADKSERKLFEISKRTNDLDLFLDFCRESKMNDYRWVGFNSIGFDYPVVHWILKRAMDAKAKREKLKLTVNQIYKYAMKVIESKKDGQFGINVKVEDHIIRQLDLFKINHYDNKAKMTSLKLLEFNMRLDNISDLPFPVGKVLSSDEMDTLIEYNFTDVGATHDFYQLNYDSIKFRAELTQKYGFDCTNLNDSNIGEQFFIRKIEAKQPDAFYTYDVVSGKKKLKKTPRPFVKIADCLFDYLNFKTPEMQALHNWFKKQVITETKGVFSDIEEHNLGDLAKYCELVQKEVKFKDNPSEKEKQDFLKEHPLGWFEVRELKTLETLKDEDGNSVKENFIDDKGRVKQRVVKVPKKAYYGCYKIAETLNVIIGGMRVDYGVGGLHGAVQGHHKKSDDKSILSWDVASMYPNIAIANRVYPEHLNESFCDSYEDFYNERKKYPKGTGENLAIKLGLNCVYGKSNSEFSCFYDSAYTMKITVNGQLTLSMLLERLVLDCQVKPLMANTDGFEVIIDNDKIDKANDIVSRWEKYVGLQMEGVEYSDMWIRDVNNYSALYTDGKIKQKGAYEYKPFLEKDLGMMHKNHSALVVPMAVEHELLGRGYAEDFIRSHKDKFDFMLRTKVPRGSRLVLEMDGEDIEQQNICRYYVSEDGGYLTKIMPPLKEGDEDRRMSIESGIKVKTCNDINDFSWDINYDYYIEQADKLLEFFR